PLNEGVRECLPLQEPAHPNELVRPIVIEGSRPLRDLLVDPALLRNWLQVVDSAAGLRDLPLLEPVPAFTADCRIGHGRSLPPLLTVDEADECHEQKVTAALRRSRGRSPSPPRRPVTGQPGIPPIEN